MKLLVTGAGGMVGSEVVRQARARGWNCAAFGRDALDISKPAAVAAVVEAEAPDVIVNAAAYTAVDRAEGEPAKAMRVNGDGAGNVAHSAARAGAAIVHISTDYVFRGDATKPYTPADEVAPLNVYGQTKLAGELAVREACPRHVIVRTSWVYSHEGTNFVRSMLRAGESRSELKVVNDQYGSPTSAADLAHALLAVTERVYGGSDVSGTFHFCNAGSTTWYEFAKTIFELRGGAAPSVTGIPASEFPVAARRPAWSVLDTTSFQNVFGVTPRPWKTALGETMARLA